MVRALVDNDENWLYHKLLITLKCTLADSHGKSFGEICQSPHVINLLGYPSIINEVPDLYLIFEANNRAASDSFDWSIHIECH